MIHHLNIIESYPSLTSWRKYLRMALQFLLKGKHEIREYLIAYEYSSVTSCLNCRLSAANCPIQYMFNQFICAICRFEMKPCEGTFINNIGSSKPKRFRPWYEPLLCRVCLAKKEAMEGKIINCISS